MIGNESIASSSVRLNDFLPRIITSLKRETRQEPGLKKFLESTDLIPAVAIAIALAVGVAARLFVRLLHLLRFFGWPIVILLAEHATGRKCPRDQNQSHKCHSQYSFNFSHNHLPPPRFLHFTLEERRGVRAAFSFCNIDATDPA
jgi:hypothetical protein